MSATTLSRTTTRQSTASPVIRRGGSLRGKREERRRGMFKADAGEHVWRSISAKHHCSIEPSDLIDQRKDPPCTSPLSFQRFSCSSHLPSPTRLPPTKQSPNLLRTLLSEKLVRNMPPTTHLLYSYSRFPQNQRLLREQRASAQRSKMLACTAATAMRSPHTQATSGTGSFGAISRVDAMRSVIGRVVMQVMDHVMEGIARCAWRGTGR